MLAKTIFITAVILFSSIAKAESVWIDVRSAVEHAIDSIDGDPRVSHSEILSLVSKKYVDKDTEIHLYCRSGVRSGKAMSALTDAGYTNVHNAGGIDDARRARGLTEAADN